MSLDGNFQVRLRGRWTTTGPPGASSVNTVTLLTSPLTLCKPRAQDRQSRNHKHQSVRRRLTRGGEGITTSLMTPLRRAGDAEGVLLFRGGALVDICTSPVASSSESPRSGSLSSAVSVSELAAALVLLDRE